MSTPSHCPGCDGVDRNIHDEMTNCAGCPDPRGYRVDVMDTPMQFAKPYICPSCAEQAATIAALTADLRAVGKALSFYADPVSYMLWTANPDYPMAVVKDTGARAREALARSGVRKILEETP